MFSLLVPFSLPNPETGQRNTYLRKCFLPFCIPFKRIFCPLKKEQIKKNKKQNRFLRVKFMQSKIPKSDSPKSLMFSFVLLLVYFSCNVAFI